jgi:RHS repeat-associated protein
MTYDTAGNLTTDSYTGVGNRTYDAENRMTTAADNTGQVSRYTYDDDGRRIRRQVASSQEEWQIYGIDNELLAEYRAGQPASAPAKEYGYRNGQLLITATGRLNVALAANGAVATASSAHTCCGFSTGGAINGNNRGPWGLGEGWNDATENVVPDWIQVDFAGSKTIDQIDVFSLHDNYTQQNTPTETQTFTLYGLLAFNVQYWNGSSWMTITGGSVTGNNKVWRKFTFSPITTSKIRVYITAVPDAWSRMVEIQAFGTSASGEKVQWLVTDQLGTPRMIIDQTGTLANVKRHDYLPFGDELFAPAGGRSTALGYSSGDGVRQQFTQKERDDETGLDYFGARYYSSTQGRFTGVDPAPLKLNHLVNPQDLNRYAYVANNPLIFVDPNGEEKIIVVIQTFIPFPYVKAGRRYFEGDNREVGQPGGFRTQQIIIIETDPKQNGGNPLVNASKDIGITHELSGPNGEIIGSGQGTGDTISQVTYRNERGAVVINVKGDEANPLIYSPGITYDLKVTVTSQGPTGSASVQVTGAHDGFPAYEISISRPEVANTTATTVYSSDPRVINTNPYALFGSMDVPVNTQAVTLTPPPPPPPATAPKPSPPQPRRRRGKKGRSEDDD